MRSGSPNPLEFVRRFAQRRAALPERCELCGLGLADEHAHLVEPAARRLVCVCDPCGVLFDQDRAGRFRRVPRRVQALDEFRLTDTGWAGLELPVNLVFFLHSTPVGRVVAVYPSPGGATEANLAPEDWAGLLEENPRLRTLEPDVEALLVNRIGDAREHYRVGIDRCYELVGLVRTHWTGFSGGTAMWHEVGRFFNRLREKAGGRATDA